MMVPGTLEWSWTFPITEWHHTRPLPCSHVFGDVDHLLLLPAASKYIDTIFGFILTILSFYLKKNKLVSAVYVYNGVHAHVHTAFRGQSFGFLGSGVISCELTGAVWVLRAKCKSSTRTVCDFKAEPSLQAHYILNCHFKMYLILCVCCMCGTHVCVYTCFHVCGCIHVEARGWCWVSSSSGISLPFWSNSTSLVHQLTPGKPQVLG